MRTLATSVAILAAMLSAGGCGADTTPTVVGPSPFIAQVGGVWSGTQTVTTAEGPFCTPVLMRPGTAEPVSLSVQQTDDQLTARLASAGTGLACTYTGRATISDVVLDSASCDDQLVVVLCQEGGVRDLKLIGSTLTATVRGGVASGTVANIYNVFPPGSDTGTGSLVVRYAYSATRR